MILKNGSFSDFAAEVRSNNKKIIFFGAGTMMTAWIPYICRNYALEQFILCCVDNDEKKWNDRISIENKTINIIPLSALCQHDLRNTVILITSSYFSGIVEQLDYCAWLDDTPCFIAPVMHITHREKGGRPLTMEGLEPRIPKVIHYCWFGGGEMPLKNRECMESWKRFCPGYEIVRWDETNYDISKNLYMNQAYERKKYGFVPDYARIDILYRYGGLYFDTDVELIREPVELLALNGFCSFEEWPDINFGSGSGAVSGSPVLEKILEFRKDIPFVNEDGSLNLHSCGFFETPPLEAMGLKLDGRLQTIQKFAVLPFDYFNPVSSITGRNCRSDRTVSIHYMNWFWAGEDRIEDRKKTTQMFDTVMERVEKGGRRDG